MKRIYLLAFLIALFLYWPGLTAPYYLDDSHVLNNARHVWSPLRILGYSSFWLTDQIALLFAETLPLPEAVYHRLWNIGIHAGAATALYWLLLQLAGRFTAAGVALLFLVHPLQTQAVTYITQRFESQASLFMILSAGCYVRFRKSDVWPWLAGSGLFALAGVLTKETAIVVILWILLIEWCFFESEWRRILYALSPVAFVLAVIAWLKVAPSLVSVFTWIPLDQYWLSQGHVIVKYLDLAIWPTPQFLWYDFRPVESLSFAVLLRWSIVIAILVVGLCYRRSLAGFGLLSFFVLLLPVLILPLPDMLNEHRMYLPMSGLAMSLMGTLRLQENPKG